MEYPKCDSNRLQKACLTSNPPHWSSSERTHITIKTGELKWLTNNLFLV